MHFSVTASCMLANVGVDTQVCGLNQLFLTTPLPFPCLQQMKVVSVEKKNYGKFHTGDSYICLHVSLLRSGLSCIWGRDRW